MAIIRRRHLPPKEHAGHKKLDPDPVSFVGRIESVERHSEKPRSRYTIIIDAFDARLDPDALGLSLPEWDRSRLAIVRVMTTADRFARMAGLEGAFDADGNELLAGLWVQLELLRPGNRSEPRVQLCRLGERGYEEPEILAVSDITSFGFDPTEPVSLGAAANRGSVLAARARRRGILHGLPLSTTVSRSDLRATREKLIASDTAKVVVHDVGHASMTTLVDVSGAPILHFDAGWPIGFNRKTYPKNEPSAPFANLVVISHWDWDHLHGYHKWPGIRNAIWCVPDQELGLNAKLVAEDLMNRKRLILVPPGRRTSFQFNSIQIILVDPPLAGSKSVLRNNSGIAMLVETTVGGIVLLPGDADYARFYSLCAKPPDRLVVSHHGADVHGAIPPAPAPGGRGVVSCGADNCYKHPSISSILAHTAADWLLEFTSTTPSKLGWPSAKRGDRELR